VSTPKTLRGFDRLFTEVNARRTAVIYRTPKSDDEWIAYYRDLIATTEELRELYQVATNVAPLPAEGLESITRSAFRAAGYHCETSIEDMRRRLATLQLDSGSTE
jgi:hypothetical protein